MPQSGKRRRITDNSIASVQFGFGTILSYQTSVRDAASADLGSKPSFYAFCPFQGFFPFGDHLRFVGETRSSYEMAVQLILKAATLKLRGRFRLVLAEVAENRQKPLYPA
ncbi:hypothetical protein OA90_15445 [Labrenzia sp. OB1]|nr:hypothetical protein OA90_15445 [Labrenzia sp. OB1]